MENRLDSHLAAAPEYDFARLRLLRRDDGAHARSYDGGFLGGNLRERVAEVFLMVERDGRYRDGRRSCARRRVETAAQTRFENREFDSRVAEGAERDCRHLLEEGRERARLFAHAPRGFANFRGLSRKLLAGDFAAVDANALLYRDEVRRRVEPRA